MPSAAPPIVTLVFAAALALINLWLGFRVSGARYKVKVSIGDGGEPLLIARMRSQANFIENVPVSLILMAIIEMLGGRGTALWVIGAVLVIGRLLHPFGMERPSPNVPRAGGIMLTYAATIALIVWAVWILLHPPAAITYF